VQFLKAVRIVVWINESVLLSTFDVASSSTRICGTNAQQVQQDWIEMESSRLTDN
jgi:hypothetical protein